MSTAYLFVDVDGVLNPFGLQGRKLPPGYRLTPVDLGGVEYPIIYHPDMGEWLTKLAADFDAELVWCTTWEDKAPQLIAPLVGLPAMPYVPLYPPKMGASTGWTKAHSIRLWMDEHGEKPFVWFDDEADCGHWIGRELSGVKALWVRCYISKGLRPEPELATARRFLQSELPPAG